MKINYDVMPIKLKVSIKKVFKYLLGVVDEYWAMREPGQYGHFKPKCDIIRPINNNEHG